MRSEEVPRGRAVAGDGLPGWCFSNPVRNDVVNRVCARNSRGLRSSGGLLRYISGEYPGSYVRRTFFVQRRPMSQPELLQVVVVGDPALVKETCGEPALGEVSVRPAPKREEDGASEAPKPEKSPPVGCTHGRSSHSMWMRSGSQRKHWRAGDDSALRRQRGGPAAGCREGRSRGRSDSPNTGMPQRATYMRFPPAGWIRTSHPRNAQGGSSARRPAIQREGTVADDHLYDARLYR